MLSDQYITVSDLNSYIKTYLENNYFLQEIFIKGEISNFKKHQSGTFYFAIKDDKARVNVVMFPGYAKRVLVPLKDGDSVLIKGRISVYEASGSYSIQASEIIYDSIGMLYLKYEQLKKDLAAEGLFDESHKVALKKYPETIGIITAPYGAAIHDMVKTIRSRWPMAKVILFPSLVQGESAAADIVKNIKLADNYGLDVIICGRGGGSIEDLWPFNEEIVARAIYACNTPIISAVGHQNDFTIADFVADARGLTPTDGAMKATSNLIDVKQVVDNYKSNLIYYMSNIIKLKRKSLDNLSNSYVLKNPTKIYENYRYKLDDLENRLNMSIKDLKHKEEIHVNNLKSRLNNSINYYLKNQRNDFTKLVTKLDTLSPLKVLNRGYSLALKDKKAIKSIEDVALNDVISLEVVDGIIKANVIETEKKNGK